MERIVFFEGELVPESAAKISIRTHAFLYGTSVFEGIRAYWNNNKLHIFRMTEHYRRLHNSAKILRMNLKYSVSELENLTKELISKNNDQCDIYIRPTVYKSALKIGPSVRGVSDEFSMFTMPMGDYIDTKTAISVCTSNWRRIDDNVIPARAKVAGSYVNTALAKAEAELSGFTEAIMLDDRGHVCEGSAMNIFMVRDGQLITSPKTSNILEGITRDCIIELSRAELGLDVVEREIDRTELFIADELFFCGTGAQVSAIGSVDHYTVGTGGMGEITARLQELYFRVVRGQIDRYGHWIDAV